MDQTAIRKLSHCPSIILAIAGPWMCVLGAIYLEKAVVQPLTDYIWLGGNVYDNKEQLLMTARLFTALEAAISNLQTYYQSISKRAKEPNLKAEVSEFPYITQYDSTNFIYVSRLAPDHPEKVVYEARLDDGQRVVVKFASRYHAEAHRLLAERGLAPKLHHAGTEGGSLYGGRYMVVMDYVEGKLPHDISEGQFSKVKEAIELLHSNNIVFGDLRVPNVIARGEEDVVLVDFDWCGKEGEARYPVDLNMDPEICWAQGVGPGCVMMKEHDLHMLERLRHHRQTDNTA
ncbi:hypothetical protein C0992_007692 [Termitomyces sp. T32_za158]|nr:hypothetical protein C0992_007692 [Termitomyces sp. T32_za158]